MMFQTVIFRFSLKKDAGCKGLDRIERKTELKARALLQFLNILFFVVRRITSAIGSHRNISCYSLSFVQF